MRRLAPPAAVDGPAAAALHHRHHCLPQLAGSAPSQMMYLLGVQACSIRIDFQRGIVLASCSLSHRTMFFT